MLKFVSLTESESRNLKVGDKLWYKGEGSEPIPVEVDRIDSPGSNPHISKCHLYCIHDNDYWRNQFGKMVETGPDYTSVKMSADDLPKLVIGEILDYNNKEVADYMIVDRPGRHDNCWVLKYKNKQGKDCEYDNVNHCNAPCFSRRIPIRKYPYTITYDKLRQYKIGDKFKIYDDIVQAKGVDVKTDVEMTLTGFNAGYDGKGVSFSAVVNGKEVTRYRAISPNTMKEVCDRIEFISSPVSESDKIDWNYVRNMNIGDKLRYKDYTDKDCIISVCSKTDNSVNFDELDDNGNIIYARRFSFRSDNYSYFQNMRKLTTAEKNTDTDEINWTYIDNMKIGDRLYYKLGDENVIVQKVKNEGCFSGKDFIHFHKVEGNKLIPFSIYAKTDKTGWKQFSKIPVQKYTWDIVKNLNIGDKLYSDETDGDGVCELTVESVSDYSVNFSVTTENKVTTEWSYTEDIQQSEYDKLRPYINSEPITETPAPNTLKPVGFYNTYYVYVPDTEVIEAVNSLIEDRIDNKGVAKFTTDDVVEVIADKLNIDIDTALTKAMFSITRIYKDWKVDYTSYKSKYISDPVYEFTLATKY